MACDVHLVISTAQGQDIELEVDYVCLPTEFGSLGVMKGHADMLCAISAGEIKYRAGDADGSYIVSEGVATVSKNQVLVLCSGMKHE